MNIIFVHSGADLYGASRSLLRLGSRLVRDGNIVMAVLPFDGPLHSELENHGVKVIIETNLVTITRQETKKIQGLIKLLVKLPISVIVLYRLFLKAKPDIVHTITSVIPTSGIAARLARLPHICHIREFYYEFPTLWRFYKNLIYRFSERIICVSAPVGAQFNCRTSDEKVVVIYNGFPQDEFRPVEKSRIDKFRQQHQIQECHLLLGVIGRIKFVRKGQEVLIEAAFLLKDRYPNIRFLCIGSPFPGNEEHLEKLLSLIRKLNLEDNVIYTGDVDDIKAAIDALDILVLPSVQPEPFGGVVVEAMAFGKPVIATAIGGSLEQVKNGVTGFLVEPGNPKALAEAIEKLINDDDLRRQMGKNGHDRYLQMFEFEDFYQKIIALYQNLSKRNE